MHSQKVLRLFCNIYVWCVLSESKFVAYIAYKFLEWLNFIKKRYFIKFTGYISKFQFVQLYRFCNIWPSSDVISVEQTLIRKRWVI